MQTPKAQGQTEGNGVDSFMSRILAQGSWCRVTCSAPQHLEGPSTKYLRTLVPNATKCMVFVTRNPKYWVFGPSGTPNSGCNTGVVAYSRQIFQPLMLLCSASRNGSLVVKSRSPLAGCQVDMHLAVFGLAVWI